MHISDGLLPAKVCIGGYAIAGFLTWYTLRQIDRQPNPTENIPKASLLTAAFFAASSLRIPIPPTSVHLILNGALGAVLGWYAFPAILIGLFFQALVVGHGGLTTLGVNAVLIGLPALLAAAVFQLRGPLSKWLEASLATTICAFAAGATGLGLSALLFFGIVVITIPSGFDTPTETAALSGLLLAHLPLMMIEGLFTTLLILFVQKVKPEVLSRGKT